MSALCDYCSRSIGSRCVHCIEGVPQDGSCEPFAPTLRSVFGLRWLSTELARGRTHVLNELGFLVSLNRFRPDMTRRMLALADEVPAPEQCPKPYPPGRPFLHFLSAADKSHAVLFLRREGMNGLERQTGLTLEFADLETLGDATAILVGAGAIEFRVTGTLREELIDPEFQCPFCGERNPSKLFAGDKPGSIRCASCEREYQPLWGGRGTENE